MFAQVWPHATDEENEPLLVVGNEEIIADVEWLNTHIAAQHGEIPQTLREQLHHDWKHTPPFQQAKELKQFHEAFLARTEAHSQRYYLSIDSLHGMQTRYWWRLPTQQREQAEVFVQLLSAETSFASHIPPVIQTISNALSDPSIQILVDQLGTLKRLPPVAFIPPDYLLFGTTLFLAPGGLSDYQIQKIQAEVTFLDIDSSAREEIQRIFYTS